MSLIPPQKIKRVDISPCTEISYRNQISILFHILVLKVLLLRVFFYLRFKKLNGRLCLESYNFRIC